MRGTWQPTCIITVRMNTFVGSKNPGSIALSRSTKSGLVSVVLVVAGLLAQRSAFAQQLVDAPEPKLISAATARPFVIRPKGPVMHEFFDHQNIIAFSTAVALRTADSAYTCAVGVGTTTHNADGSITVRREDFMPVNSCHGVVLMNAAFTGAGLGGSYLLHKMGRHKLERFPNWIAASVPALGIAYTATHQHVRAAILPGR